MIPKNKRIEWSYPTSENAIKLGFAKSGCWTVEVCKYRIDGTPIPPLAIVGFPLLEQAKEYAETVDLPYNRLTK